jgi:uncharacterized protein (TIGR00369 family)
LKIKNLGIDEGLFNRISEVAQHMPFYNLLGIRITALGPGYAELMVSTGADHANNLDIVHGGLLLSLADGAMGNAVRSLGILATTVDFNTALMSAAPLGQDIIAQGQVIKAGRNLIFTKAQAFVGDKQVLETRGTFFRMGKIDFEE